MSFRLLLIVKSSLENMFRSYHFQFLPASKSPLKTRRIVPVGVMITGSLNMDCGLMF